MDYAHFNPVKHGLVEHPADWPHSLFRGAWMADCIPMDGGAAVMNRERSASGFEIQARGEAEG